MNQRNRIEAYGIRVGNLLKGKRNKISDVNGVRVGHCTLDTERNKTGVTVVLPAADALCRERWIAACHVFNGFGKTLGLMQIEELGVIETPIALTNTLEVGRIHDALVEVMLEAAARRGLPLRSVNPVVAECNDADLNDIAHRVLGREHLRHALSDARADFAEGDVGAGKGVSCHGLKGGIGSASRVFALDGRDYTLGVLVQSNHGKLEDLTVGGRPVGAEIAARLDPDGKRASEPDKGSIIVVVATDLPCTSRQLGRICRRAGVGLARLGSFVGHGSGEVAIAFTTAHPRPWCADRAVLPVFMLDEERLDAAFRAVAEATEEAVLNSMLMARRVVGYSGAVRETLADCPGLSFREAESKA